MTYFTIVHVITLLILFVFFVLLFMVSLRETRKKIFWAMIFANFLVVTTLAVFSMLVLDKYTKKARIENLNQKRVLMNETIVFSGQIRNIGRFKIGKCNLEVKLVNNPITSKKLGSSDVFKPTAGFEFMKKNSKSSTVKKVFTIAKGLKPKELKNFSVSMPYPPYFSKASAHHYLRCH